MVGAMLVPWLRWRHATRPALGKGGAWIEFLQNEQLAINQHQDRIETAAGGTTVRRKNTSTPGISHELLDPCIRVDWGWGRSPPQWRSTASTAGHQPSTWRCALALLRATGAVEAPICCTGKLPAMPAHRKVAAAANGAHPCPRCATPVSGVRS